jgi:hypothetical protein
MIKPWNPLRPCSPAWWPRASASATRTVCRAPRGRCIAGSARSTRTNFYRGCRSSAGLTSKPSASGCAAAHEACAARRQIRTAAGLEPEYQCCRASIAHRHRRSCLGGGCCRCCTCVQRGVCVPMERRGLSDPPFDARATLLPACLAGYAGQVARRATRVHRCPAVAEQQRSAAQTHSRGGRHVGGQCALPMCMIQLRRNARRCAQRPRVQRSGTYEALQLTSVGPCACVGVTVSRDSRAAHAMPVVGLAWCCEMRGSVLVWPLAYACEYTCIGLLIL